MIESLLAAHEPGEYIEGFLRWWKSDPDKGRLQLRAARDLAPRVYRKEYPRHPPHDYMGVIAAIQSGSWLAPEVRMDPLMQAFWSAAENRLMPPFDLKALRNAGAKDVSGPKGAAATAKGFAAYREPLDSLWSEGHVEGVCAVVARAVNSRARDSMVEWLLRQTMPDGWDLGHRLIYMAWCLRLCRWAEWEKPSALLFPAIHFALGAPADASIALWLETILAHNPIRQDHIAGPSSHIGEGQLEALSEAISGNDAERLVAAELSILTGGASPKALYDGLLLAGARLLVCSDPADWYAPVHAFLYLDALHVALEHLEPCDQVEALLLGSLFAQKAAGEIERLDSQAPDCDVPLAEEVSSFTVWADLAAALDAADVRAALNLFGSIPFAARNDRSLAVFFPAYAARNNGRVYFSHDTKLVCALLLAHSRSKSPLKSRLLAALIHFLALSEKDDSLWRMLGNRLK